MTDFFCEHFKAKSDSCNQHISNQILQFIGRQLAKDFLDRSGFKDTPQVLMNGVPIESKSLNGEDFEEAIMMGLMRETNTLQKAVYKNTLTDKVRQC